MPNSLKCKIKKLGYKGLLFEKDVERIIKALSQSTRERGTCLNCAMNWGLMHCEEFNPHDIVCEYWESDGLDKDDYCSQWKKANKGEEDAE